MDTILKVLATFRFFIAATAAALRKLDLTATVEAEFGDDCVEGSQITLAHHGSRGANLPPCVAQVESLSPGSTVGLSHFDLDTLGGILRLAGYQPKDRVTFLPVQAAFWALAAWVDVRGPHRLSDGLVLLGKEGLYGVRTADTMRAERCLWAWWAWSQTHRLYPPRPNDEGEAEAADCSAFVQEAAQTVLAILDGDEDLLTAGDKWRAAEMDLNRSSFLRTVEVGEKGWRVVVRRAKAFTNHMYRTPAGQVGQVVVALDDRNGSVIVSREGDSVPIVAVDVVQGLWGDKAGGHPWIAGSPREEKFGLDELNAAVEAVVKALS